MNLGRLDVDINPENFHASKNPASVWTALSWFRAPVYFISKSVELLILIAM